MNDPTTIRRLYGRSKGRPLRAGQSELVDRLLPQLAVPEEGPIDSRSLFGDERPLHFEIGFGAGEHLAFRADLLPDHGFIGAEPFLNGVAAALGHVRDRGLGNVRLHMGDALAVLGRLPDASLTFVYLLHPDPWPKARHAKRRMVNPGPLDLIARKLKPGGELRIGTDDPTYCRWTMMVMDGRRDFEWLAESARDFLTRPGGWPETRYEAKARREGREVWYFRYRRSDVDKSGEPACEGAMMATLSVCNNPACAVTVEEKRETCPKCGGPMRRVGDSPARGIVLLITGLFLLGAGGALSLFLGPMMLNPDPARFTGSPAQGRLFFSLFVLVALMGLAGLGNGIHLMRTGQQSGLLKILTLAVGAILVLMAVYIIMAMPKPA